MSKIVRCTIEELGKLPASKIDEDHDLYWLGGIDRQERFDPRWLEMSKGPWLKVYHVLKDFPIESLPSFGTGEIALSRRVDGAIIASGYSLGTPEFKAEYACEAMA